MIVDAVPWPSSIPSPNGEITRIVLLSHNSEGELEVSARFELPGEGLVAVCANGEREY